jgi:hypothetical protein
MDLKLYVSVLTELNCCGYVPATDPSAHVNEIWDTIERAGVGDFLTIQVYPSILRRNLIPGDG